jgi:uncharacterized heparinase superfamily protein
MQIRPWLDRLADRRAARAACRARPADGFALLPEPRLPGRFARGRRLAAGGFDLAGRTVETRTPFAIEPPSTAFAEALHGWGWLDDLAACGEPAARDAAREWMADWLARFGDGGGPGWRADLAGRRLLRWTEHALFLTAGSGDGLGRAFLAGLARHAAFLARRWAAAPAGLPRFEALGGWLAAGLTVQGLEAHAGPALAALTAEGAARIGPDGGIPERCPETLLWTAAHLALASGTLDRLGRPCPPELAAALQRAAGALRALRHADGGLARFHGGGAGREGLLEQVLAAAPGQARARPARAMGFERLDGGRTTLILDAAAPPEGARAQAAALGFELTSGRRPVVVNCGAGHDLGPDWEAAGRAASGASSLVIDGGSPARPLVVTRHREDGREGTTVLASHDGWVASHGLTHSRELRLSADGRTVMGEDALTALAPEDRARLGRLQAAGPLRAPEAVLRFHLHPDVEPRAEAGGARLHLASGEVWLFRVDGPVRLEIEPSVWLEPGRRLPRGCRQLALRGRVAGGGLRIGWTLAKAQATPLAIRDLGREADLDGDAALPPGYLEQD